MKVQDLLTDERFSDFSLLSGAGGINREISTVTVVDTPDGSQWLTGDELVITTAYMLKDDESALLGFIRLLNIKKVSGLCIKAGRYIQDIPESACRLADELQLPLILIPARYPFTDIINPVLSQLVNQQAAKLMQSSIIHAKFTELAISDASIPEILTTLTLIIGVPSAYLDLESRKFWYSDPSSELAQRLQYMDPLRISESALEGYDIHITANQNQRFGYLIFQKGTLDTHPDSSFQTAIENAVTNIILREQTLISNRQVAEQYKNALVHDLLINNIKSETEIHNRASIYGWDFHNGGIVAAVDINNIKQRFTEQISTNTNHLLENLTTEIFNISIEEMKKQYPNSYYMKLSDIIAFIVTVEQGERMNLAEGMERVFRGIQTRLKNIPFTITLGVGSYREKISEVHRSYEEARAAINLGYTLNWYDRALFYDKMDLYRIFVPVLESPDAMSCCERCLEPLRDYDRENGRYLLETLRQIANSDWNIKLAAERMFLHPNSVKYRFDQICTLLNMNLRERNDRLLVELALIVDMMSGEKCFRKHVKEQVDQCVPMQY